MARVNSKYTNKEGLLKPHSCRDTGGAQWA